MIGLWALIIPGRARRHPLMAGSGWLCLAVLVWQASCYTATAVTTAGIYLPHLAELLGQLHFTLGSPAVAHLLAQLALAMMLAASARSEQASEQDPNPAAIQFTVL